MLMCDLLIFQVPRPVISIVVPIRCYFFFPAALFYRWRVASDGEKLNDEHFLVKLLSSYSAK